MSGIIKTLKNKTNDIEQNVYPKTVLEAVVDSETNETLDIVLDEINNKIDNIEISGGTPVENLLVYPYAISNKATDNYTIVDNGDGTLTISCNFPELSMANVQIVSEQPISAGTYIVSGCSENFTDSTVNINVYVDDTSGNRIHYGNVSYGQNFTFTVTELCYLSISLWFNSGASLTDAVLKPMLELGTVAHDYKPYKDVSKANQTDIDNKVSKSGDTMTGTLTVKDNVSVEGDLFVPITPEQSILNSEQPNTNFTAPTAGGWQDNTSYLLQDMANSKTFLGSYMGAVDSEGHENCWHNVMSIRHRNGRDDGSNYGMYFRSAMTTAGSLVWNKECNGKWENEKVILDSVNYSNYALPLSGGTVSGSTVFNGVTYLNSKNTYLQNGSAVGHLTSDSTYGYWKFATIKMNSSATWCGAIISFKVTHRYDAVGRVELHINNGSNAGTGFTASVFRQKGNMNQCYIYQSATGVFDLYLERGAYDYVTISDLSFPKYMQDRCDIDWTNIQASLPSGATPATVTNDWTTVVTSTSSTISVSLKPYAHYIIFAYCDNGMFVWEMIASNYNGKLGRIDIYSAGSASSSISGTTYTLSFSGSATKTVLKYIEIR